jgi:hypothetical protein
MPKLPKLSLASIVAAAAPAVPKANVVASPGKPARDAERGTLKERSKQLSVYLDPAVYDQLRDIAYAERTKLHPLMLEALDLLFASRGARSIREIEAGAKTPLRRADASKRKRRSG